MRPDTPECDLKRPSCSQCERANTCCTGYRDGFSLRLRDQTSVTYRHPSRKREDRSPRSRSPRSQSPTTLPLKPEEAAIGHFLNVYVPPRVFQYITDCPSSLLGSEPVKSALLAPSLLLLSQSLSLPKLRAQALDQYCAALRLVNASLADQERAVLDSTFLSILLLGLFEALSTHGRQNPVKWRMHMLGLVELLRLRGPRQFDHRLGRSLYLHASGSIRSDCAQRCVQAPPELDALQYAIIESMDRADPALKMSMLLDRFADLRAYKDGEEPADRLDKGLALDRGLADLLGDLRVLAPFQVVNVATLSKEVFSYKNFVHRYPSLGMVRVYNTVRILKLFVVELIYRDLHSQKMVQPGKQAHILDLLAVSSEAVINDILHSVPLILEAPEATSTALSAKLVMYPLAGIGVCPLAAPDAVEFARNRLAFIGSTFGLAQASDLATMVVQRSDLEDW